MVKLSKIVFLAKETSRGIRQYRRSGFLDSIRVHVKGGAGGNGLPKFGGIGGQGGNVIFLAGDVLSLNEVLRKQSNKRFHAANGRNSSHNFILGPPGDDIRVEVPVGVTIHTDGGKVLGELNELGQEVTVAKGGCGGHPKNGFLGVFGQARSVRLDLKLIADIGLVGFPNAGKSTLLKAISHAKPKIASYPFTTVKPNVGQVMYSDLRQISMADLPGLIEGAHLNRGMGHRFLKHVERTKMLLLVVDINGFRLSPQHAHRNCLDTIILLNKELEMYKEELVDKPAMIVVNKMDTDGAEAMFNAIVDRIRNLKDYALEYPAELRPVKPLKFDEILAMSAKEGVGIAVLKQKIRYLLDLHAEINNEQQMSENLKLASRLRAQIVERAKKLV